MKVAASVPKIMKIRLKSMYDNKNGKGGIFLYVCMYVHTTCSRFVLHSLCYMYCLVVAYLITL